MDIKNMAKKAGEKLLEYVLDHVACFLYMLYEVVTDTIKGVLEFFVAAFFLYIAWGIRLFVIAMILYLICRALGAH